MVKFQNIFSSLKKKVSNKLTNLKSQFQKNYQEVKSQFQKNYQEVKSQFQKDYQEVKSEPRSKRKSLFLGFTTVLGIFGVTLLTSVLPAIAKDVPNPSPGNTASGNTASGNTASGNTASTSVAPSSCPQPALTSSAEIVKVLSGAAGTVCGLAVSSGSYIIGMACGVLVVIGILKAQGK